MQNMQKTNLTEISKELFSLALPMAFTQLLAVGSGFISIAMLSKLGPDVLAASALMFSTRTAFALIGSSILFSLSLLIGHAYAQGEKSRIGELMRQGWLLGFLISLPLLFLFWNIHHILYLCGEPAKLVNLVKEFFHANIWNVIPLVFSVCNQQLCYGVKKQSLDFIANVIGVFILLISSYILIFGKFGIPQLGVAGLGYAFDLQSVFYCCFTFIFFFCAPAFKPYSLFTSKIGNGFTCMKRLLKVGWPICTQISGEMLSFLMSAAMVGWVGIQSLAAYQVVTQYLFIILVPILALSQASGVLIGQAYGEKNFEKIQKIGYAAIIFSLAMTIAVAFIFFTFPKSLASIYLNTNNSANFETLQIVIILFAICGIQLIVDGIKNVLTGSLRGLFDTAYPMLVGLSTVWIIGIPLGYVLAFPLGMGAAGIIIGPTIGMFISILPLLVRWQRSALVIKLQSSP